jgi:protein pelota
LGAYHTVDLELHQNFTLYKNEWDSIALDRVSEACDVTKRADAGAVILQEGNFIIYTISTSFLLITVLT